MDLPGQLSAPRCFGVVGRLDEVYWIWLEDVGDGSKEWSISDYGRAARHLGQFNGAYLAGRPVPEYAWLTRGRVKSWLIDAQPIIENLHQFLHEAKRPHWLTEPQIKRLLAIWARREPLLQALDRLPRTLCHHDAFRRNLFALQERTVAVDWQILGTGAIGEEMVPLVGITLQFMNMAPAKLQALEETVLDGYVAGLRDAGWQGDERLARFGYAASAALFIGVATVGCWPSVARESRYKLAEKAIGHPIADIIANFGALQDHFLDLGDKALAMVGLFDASLQFWNLA